MEYFISFIRINCVYSASPVAPATPLPVSVNNIRLLKYKNNIIHMRRSKFTLQFLILAFI